MAKKKAPTPPRKRPKNPPGGPADCPPTSPTDERASVSCGASWAECSATPGTPLARAHDLVDQAFEEPAAGKQAGLAKQAPTPSPDRADA